MKLFLGQIYRFKKWAIVFFAFLLLAGGILPLTALALEWQWPAVPGVGTLEQMSDEAIIERCQQQNPGADLDVIQRCVQQEKNKQMGYYLKYFLYLFFFIAGGIILILIIIAGVGFLDASGNVNKIVQAKERLNRAALGAVILVSSWALLYLLNPDLLLFKAQLPVIPLTTEPGAGAGDATVAMLSFSPSETIDETLNKMLQKNPDTGILAALEPFDDGVRLLSEALLVLEGTNEPRPGLQTLLQSCRCGQSKTHLERTGALNFAVAGGLAPDDWPDEVKKTIAAKQKVNPQAICKISCDNCGTIPYENPETKKKIPCMLNSVVVKDEDVNNNNASITCPNVTDPSTGKSNLEYLWSYGNKFSPKQPPRGDIPVIPYAGSEPKDKWKKCKFVYMDKTPEKTEPEQKTWAILAVFYPEAGGWKELERTTNRDNNKDNQDNSIRYQMAHLQYLIPQLEAMQLKFSGQQMEKLGEVLTSKAMDYLMADSQAGIFEPDFEYTKKDLQQKGFTVNAEDYVVPEEDLAGASVPPASPPAAIKPFFKNKFLADLSRLVQPFTLLEAKPLIGFANVWAADPAPAKKKREPADDRFYIVSNVANEGLLLSPYPAEMLKHNQAVIREASRANLYAVLADQSIEEIEKMTGDCMTAAFGQAKYDLPENVEETIRSAVSQGTADYLVYEMARNSPKFAELIGQEIINNLGKKANGTLQKRCAGSCGCDSDCQMNEDLLKNFVNDGVNDNKPNDNYPNNKECVAACVKANIPANFVSSKISEFLTLPLFTRLPDEIEKDLTTKLRDTDIISPIINKSLDEKMGALYDKVLEGALSKSFAEQIPDLKKFLNTNIYNYLAKREGTDFIGKINSFLNFSVDKYLQERINKEAEKVASGLANELEDLVSSGVGSLKQKMPGFFPEESIKVDKGAIENECNNQPSGDQIQIPIDQCIKEGIQQETERRKEECRTDEMLRMGYLWYDGTCSKITTEAINKMISDTGGTDGGRAMDWGEDEQIVLDKNDFEGIAGEPQTVEMLCRKAGYKWSQYMEYNFDKTDKLNSYQGKKQGPWQCGEDQWVTSDIKGLTDFRTLGKKFIAGAINFIEEFAVALTETILHTVLAYVDVWVEDEVLYPLEGYIKQFSGLQDNLKKFLHSNVQQLLPSQISRTLNSNVDTVLKDICKLSPAPADEAAREAIDPITGLPFKDNHPSKDIEISLYGEKTWGTFIEIKKEDLTNEDIWLACDASRHLHTTLAKEIQSSSRIGSEIIRILNTKVIDLIPWEGAKKYLAMSPAAIIFEGTGLKDVQNIVNGTPADVLCGKIIGVDDSGFGVVGTGKVSLAEKCNTLKTQRPISVGDYSFGAITFPDFDEAKFAAESNKDLYRYYCPFVWGACQNPLASEGTLPLVGQTVGAIMKNLLAMGCGLVDKNAEDPAAGPKCQGACLGESSDALVKTLQNDLSPSCTTELKNTCEQCNILLNDSTAYFMLAAAVESDIGPVETRTNQRREDEIETYRWFRIYFPVLDNKGEIKKVAEARKIDWAEVTENNAQNYVTLDNVNNMSNDDWLKVVVLWRLGSNNGPGTVGEMLTLIPDGIIKPFKKNNATLLRPAGKGDKTNILDKTPSQTLIGDANFNGVCLKIESEYKAKYPQYTFQTIYQQVAKKYSSVVPYSMESLNRPTIAEALNQLTESPVPEEYKFPYLFCEYIKYSPAQIFGLDQELLHYVRPKEYQILFDLIENELMPGERPEFLNALLAYLYGQTPVGALQDAAVALEGAADNPDMANRWLGGETLADQAKYAADIARDIADVFSAPLLAQLKGVFKIEAGGRSEKKIITQLCETFPSLKCGEELQIDDDAWTEIQTMLLKSPIDLLAEALDYKLPNPLGLDLKNKACRKKSPITKGCAEGETPEGDLCCKNVNSLMDAAGLFWPFLGDPYVDSLFNAAGWTDDVYKFVEETENTWDDIDNKEIKAKAAISSAIDKIVLEAPAAVFSYVGTKLADLVGLNVGDDLGNNMAGRCWEMAPDDVCDTGHGQVKRTTAEGKEECCDTAGALVCVNKCRALGDGENGCNEKQGEKLKEGSDDICCYEGISGGGGEGYKCRELKSTLETGGGICNREGETLIKRINDAGTQELTLCCKKRTTSLLAGPGYPKGNEPDAKGEHKLCCETIEECITGKFLNHLNSIKDYLIDGVPVNVESLLPEKDRAKLKTENEK